MIRLRKIWVPVMALVLAAAFVGAAEAQDRPRRGGGRGMGGGSLLGLLRNAQVQKELKLNDEQIEKVKKINEKFGADMRKEFTALRDIEDRAKRRAKMTELRSQFEAKGRKEVEAVLAKEQMTRLCQIRLQTRPVLDSLTSKEVAEKLKVTGEQKEKLTKIGKDLQAKRMEMFTNMRDATPEQRTEARTKYTKLRTDAEKEALAVLTADQKKAFEAMKGKEIKLERRRRAPRD